MLQIGNLFSEKEIFAIIVFAKIYLFYILLEQNIISIEAIIKNINNQENNYWDIVKNFYPEIREYVEKYQSQIMITDKNNRLKKIIEENDQSLEFYFKKRKEGVKEPKIIELIKEDKIKEFISFVEHFPKDLNEKIQREDSIYKTNTEELTPIEYSARFGSVAIFKKLYLKNVNIIVKENQSNIIEYSIQGRNYEIIHLLEERKEIIEKLKTSKHQHIFLEISIKMNYNEIYEYLMGNYNIQITEEIIRLIINYRNYHLLNQLIELKQIELKNRAIITGIFQQMCINGNEEIVKILINQPNLDINSKNDILYYFVEKNKKKKKRIEVSR